MGQNGQDIGALDQVDRNAKYKLNIYINALVSDDEFNQHKERLRAPQINRFIK